MKAKAFFIGNNCLLKSTENAKTRLDFERKIQNINPLHVTGLFLYPLNTSENWSFSDVFR